MAKMNMEEFALFLLCSLSTKRLKMLYLETMSSVDAALNLQAMICPQFVAYNKEHPVLFTYTSVSFMFLTVH